MNKKKYIPVMLTPFTKDKSIDYPALKELIQFYLEAGAEGLFANCLSSEMYHLSREEMLDLCNYVVAEVNGKVPVVATGSFGNTLNQKAETVKAIYSTGVTGVIVITGLMAEEHEDDATFKANILQLLQLTSPVPLGFYECPVPYKRLMPAALLQELVETGRVTYHKDTCLDIEEVREKLEATRSFPTFGLYDAYMEHAVATLQAGSAGLSCIQGNYFPELATWLCEHYEDTTPEVIEVQDFYVRNMEVMHRTYPASAKYILAKRGLRIEEYCRNESAVPAGEHPALDELLREFQKLAARIQLEPVR
jgi:4-hydroxy-tetrahydrodipicolinate synthase